MSKSNPFSRFQAIRALANLDQDDPNSAKYEDGVFLVHPPYRTKQAPKFDVVFIHGLGGGVSSTWTTKDTSFCSRGNKSEKLVNWLDKWVSRKGFLTCISALNYLILVKLSNLKKGLKT